MTEKPVGQQDRAVPVLELRKVSKHFGGVAANEDIDITVMPHQIVAVVGHNGAGKSTLLRMVSGVMQPDSGTILMNGAPVRLRSVREARAHGIETVPQELALSPKLNVASNVFLGREPLATPRWLRVVARRRMEAEARELVGSLGVQIPDMRTKVGALSGGQRQGIAIARAIGWGRSVVVLDEPTAALGVHETSEVERTMLRMKEMGLGLLLVSHDLDQVFRVADHVYVLYHGRVVGSLDPHRSSHDQVLGMITGMASADSSLTAAQAGKARGEVAR